MTVVTGSNEKPERSKTERLEARLSKEQKELFQRAADILGLTLTDFVIISLQSAAKQAIQEHEIMTLSRRDQEVFVEALLNPPAPSTKLRAAAQSYKHKMGA
jgi:uncharacterized protein (DUF1778 family)